MAAMKKRHAQKQVTMALGHDLEDRPRCAEAVKWSNRLGREPGLNGGFMFCGTNLSRFSFRHGLFL